MISNRVNCFIDRSAYINISIYWKHNSCPGLILYLFVFVGLDTPVVIQRSELDCWRWYLVLSSAGYLCIRCGGGGGGRPGTQEWEGGSNVRQSAGIQREETNTQPWLTEARGGGQTVTTSQLWQPTASAVQTKTCQPENFMIFWWLSVCNNKAMYGVTLPVETRNKLCNPGRRETLFERCVNVWLTKYKVQKNSFLLNNVSMLKQRTIHIYLKQSSVFVWT